MRNVFMKIFLDDGPLLEPAPEDNMVAPREEIAAEIIPLPENDEVDEAVVQT